MIFLYKKVFYILCLLAAVTSVSLGQRYPFKTYNLEDGLPQSTVTSVLQDSKGYIWIATLNGIARFDGKKFLNYSTKNGLINASASSLAEDNAGAIWVGTETGVSKFVNGKFINYTTEEGFGKGRVWAIIKGMDSSLFFGTEEGGVTVVKGDKISNLTTKNGLISNLVQSLFYDSLTHSLWIGTQEGLSVYNGKKFTNYTVADGLPDNFIKAIKKDASGTMWFGTKGSGLCRLRRGKFTNFTKADGLPDSIIYSLETDKLGNLWIGTKEGIGKFQAGHFTIIKPGQGLEGKIILSIKRDREDNLWFGTYEGGLSILPSEKFLSYNKETGLISNSVYSICEDKKGNMWFGMQEGLSKLTKNGFKQFTTKNGLPGNFIRVLEDSKGNIWVGTDNGICVIDDDKFIDIKGKEILSGEEILSIFEDTDKNIWFGTNGNGAVLYDGKKWTRYTKKNGLRDNDIYSIIEDRYGQIWFGTYDGGLSKWDGSNFINYMDPAECIKKIYALTEDSKGNIWISTFNGGVVKFKDNVFTVYKREEGLSDNICYFTIEDDQNNMWIGTNNGLNKYDGKKFTVYTVKSGLLSNEMNTNAALKDRNGNLWFGTVKGVTRYNPKLDIPNTIPPPIYITSITVKDETEKQLEIKDGLSLSYTENYLNFNWIGLSFKSPENILYQYKLVGVDRDWQNTSATTVQYTSLVPSDYIFEVRARNADGVWSTKTASVSFSIDPAFWNTWWFRAIMILFAGGIIYGTYLYKTFQIKQRSVELERVVKERTQELEVEKNKSDALLLNILPAQLVEELKEKGFTKPREFKMISILFTDFKGFTNISATLPAEKLVNELNDIFKMFDAIIERYGLEKLKTIGDSYMIGAGLPRETEDHAQRIVMAAMQMHNCVNERNKTSAVKWQMRAGVHSGNVVAGVVGTKKFTYDIWGDAVNIASRMESSCEPGRINISAYTFDLIREYFECEYRGKVDAKGKGEIDMYFVTGLKSGTTEEFMLNLKEDAYT